jgi:hypothetical protein
MKSLFFKNCLVILLLLGMALSCGAEEPGNLVSFDFQCIGLSKDFRRVDVYFGSGEDQPRKRVRLGDLSKSLAHHYQGPPLILFYDQPSGGQLVARAQLKPSMKSPLFIFNHAPDKSNMKYSVFPIENDWSEHGVNSYLLINLSSRVLYWKVGEQRFKLEAKSKHAISVDGGEEKTPIVVLESKSDGKVSRVYRAKWRNKANLRRLVFIRDAGPNELGSVRVQVVEDFERSKSAAAKPEA